MLNQDELFAAPPIVPGLRFAEEVVSEAEEAELAARVDRAPLAPFQYGPWQARRMTAHYGSRYDYSSRTVDPAPPFPSWLADLRDRLGPLVAVDPASIEQALLIRYDPGAGIGWHRDRPHYEDVLALSLSTPAVLKLRRRKGKKAFERREVLLPPRSLYRLSGEVRCEWEHSIDPMDLTRRSITFRTLA